MELEVLDRPLVGEVETDQHIVLIYCGYSDWFHTHDVRPLGPFESQDEADAFKESLDARKLQRRDGEGTILVKSLRIGLIDPMEFEV